MTWPFGDLPLFSYDLIEADPPWQFRLYSDNGHAKSPQAHYGTLTFTQLAMLPVGHLAKPDAVLLMWTTWPMLVTGMPLKLLHSWGFQASTGGAWAKRSTTGRAWNFGTGYRLRSACEPFLLATIGSPLTTRAERNLIDAPIREHSRKPDAFYAMAERLMPGARRCSLFSRVERPGWDCWGDEVGKFDEAATG